MVTSVFSLDRHHQKNITFSEERWKEICKCKEKLLQNENEDPRTNLYMNQEVAASWVRSKKLGINPYINATKPQLDLAEYQKILNDNRLLIDITRPLVHTFKEMAILVSGYILYLCDKNGTFLLQEGEMFRMSTEGLIWNENTVGTCAHSLCMRSKKPVQLLGPEHYCVELRNIVGTAAPILDESGEPIASLILGQRMIDRPWEENFQNLCSHTLGLITSLAAAVEGQMELNKLNQRLTESYKNLRVVNDNLTTAHNTLQTTLAFIDEGIVTIDRSGTIIHINQEGMRIFKIKPEEIGIRNIKEFLGNESQVMYLVENGKNVDIEETVCLGNDKQPYVMNIRPILNRSSRQVDVAVLRLNHVEKINAMVAKHSGAIARYTFQDIIGENVAYKRVVSLAQRFSNSLENVLLIGESGTGKELFAQAIHNSQRSRGSFMAVNCAAMPRELIESELFGYEGGSFTGAERSGRPGKIELANGGTLFLDEIGDMPIELQGVLLRALEDKQVMRIGGRSYKKVDFRLIAATNRDLHLMVKEKQFREDLYFRLSVLTINIPPLRERKNDIELLSKFFIKNYCLKQGWRIPQISPAVLKIIIEYEWPGNVRQLQNAMIYAVNIAQGDVIEPENLPNYILQDSLSMQIDQDKEVLHLEKLERITIERAILQADNCIPAAAEILGISRSTLYRKLKEYNIPH
jgi:transcriptional regulator with PAS, ATPase and Fis domain